MSLKRQEFYFLNNKNLLVTGGAGFIGSHLCEILVKAGANVSVVDNLSNGNLENLSSIMNKIKFEKLNILSYKFNEFIKKRKFDIIFHLASPSYVPPSINDPAFDYKNSLFATFRILDGIRKNELSSKFVFASSAAVYGNPDKLPMSELDSTFPISPYGVAKLAAERYVSVYSKLYKIKAVSLRFFSVYGPRQCKQIIYDFIDKLSRNSKELKIIGNGTQERDMIYVEDLVQAIIKVIKGGKWEGEVYNVAAGNRNSSFEIAKIVAEVMKLDPKYIFTENVRPGDAQKWLADIKKLKKLGFSPRYSLKKGIREITNWYQHNKEVNN